MHAIFKSSPRHEEVKGAHKIRKKSRATKNILIEIMKCQNFA